VRRRGGGTTEGIEDRCTIASAWKSVMANLDSGHIHRQRERLVFVQFLQGQNLHSIVEVQNYRIVLRST